MKTIIEFIVDAIWLYIIASILLGALKWSVIFITSTQAISLFVGAIIITTYKKIAKEK